MDLEASMMRTAVHTHMVDLPRDQGTGDRTRTGAGPAPTASAPRWVKVFGMIFLILALVFVTLHLAGKSPGHAPSSAVTEHGMQLP
jgi:hypothetical protein